MPAPFIIATEPSDAFGNEPRQLVDLGGGYCALLTQNNPTSGSTTVRLYLIHVENQTVDMSVIFTGTVLNRSSILFRREGGLMVALYAVNPATSVYQVWVRALDELGNIATTSGEWLTGLTLPAGYCVGDIAGCPAETGLGAGDAIIALNRTMGSSLSREVRMLRVTTHGVIKWNVLVQSGDSTNNNIPYSPSVAQLGSFNGIVISWAVRNFSVGVYTQVAARFDNTGAPFGGAVLTVFTGEPFVQVTSILDAMPNENVLLSRVANDFNPAFETYEIEADDGAASGLDVARSDLMGVAEDGGASLIYPTISQYDSSIAWTCLSFTAIVGYTTFLPVTANIPPNYGALGPTLLGETGEPGNQQDGRLISYDTDKWAAVFKVDFGDIYMQLVTFDAPPDPTPTRKTIDAINYGLVSMPCIPCAPVLIRNGRWQPIV